MFSLLLALAVRDGRLTRNVAAGVRLPRVGRADKVFLTHAQDVYADLFENDLDQVADRLDLAAARATAD